MLSRHGYPLQPDGDFGFLTRAAVIGFKEKHGLSVDGMAGPRTYELLVR